MNNNIKNEVATSTVAAIETLSLAALSTDDKAEKIVALEEMRSCFNRLAFVVNSDFDHPNICFYSHVTISLIDMSIMGLRNIVETMHAGNINECIANADEILDVLDRWEESNEE